MQRKQIKMGIEKTNESETPKASFFIDITDQACPLTFVKTKLLIESMPVGGIAEVRLKGAEALENVPRSVREHGHIVLALIPDKRSRSKDKAYRLILKKTKGEGDLLK